MNMINPKKELFKWGPIEFKVFYGSFFVEALWLHVYKNYPWPWPPFYFIHHQGRATFVGDDLELRRTGENYFKKYFLDLKNYKKHWALWEKWMREYEKRAEQYEKINFSKISDSELLNLFQDFYKFNIKFWLIVHVPEIANWGGEKMLRQRLEKIDKERVDEYLEILSAPVKYSFFQKEELELLGVALKCQSVIPAKAGIHGSPIGSGMTLLKRHAQKYRWLLNSYGGNRILKTNYFAEKLKELLKEKTADEKIKEIQNIVKNNKQRKEHLIKKLKLSRETALMAEQLAQSIWWQDLRKGYIWRMNYFWDKFLKKIANRTSWKFEELLWCWPGELIKIFENKKINKQKILSRKKSYAVYLGKGLMKHVYGKVAQNLLKIYQPKVEREIKELKGLAVSRGAPTLPAGRPVRGRVKIIQDPFRELGKMKQGDILVAGMTSPEFIVVMKKAKAIITDHGGMTSHAAIVSRELGVPCIVGTKIATKVLKDGDLVEVNADKGSVKKLK
jgi:phosphohistidine swiveling domain-containing protein